MVDDAPVNMPYRVVTGGDQAPATAGTSRTETSAAMARWDSGRSGVVGRWSDSGHGDHSRNADLTSCSPSVPTVDGMTESESNESTSIAEALHEVQQQERAEQVEHLRKEFDTTDKIAETLGQPDGPQNAA